ncbi:3-oxoacyl-ACP reductase FabG [Pseudonocardia ailaonensis]|uniref:3-oxoacyl-ACP reductase FabG n=1 Tax=Pseudonocardia ailaonensis TaxID=367279 RepID=A0ABN2MIG3_9PSEU
MEEFTGRVGVVTGAANGIGYAIARSLVNGGATVVVADVAGADEAARALTLEGPGKAVGIRCDVTSEEDVAAAAAAAVEHGGSLDHWVNNAGFTRDMTMRRMTLEDFRAVIDVHLVGGWLGTRAAAAVMREQGRGTIVNISSTSAKTGNPGQTNYSAAKAGLIGLTKAAAKELGHLGIRVNAVQPGLVRTPMIEKLKPEILEARLADTPLGRFGEVEDVADTVSYLLSDRSAFLTGAVIQVSGGRHM